MKPEKIKYYIASKLENVAQVRALKQLLDATGDYEHTYDWTVHGSVQQEGHNRIREVANAEAEGVQRAGLVIVLLPGGRGTHVEIGLAIASGADVIIYSANPAKDFGDGGETCAFYHHSYVKQVSTWGELLNELGLEMGEPE